MAIQNFGSGGGFQLSPGINVSEIDLTTSTGAVDTTTGAIAGADGAPFLLAPARMNCDLLLMTFL